MTPHSKLARNIRDRIKHADLSVKVMIQEKVGQWVRDLVVKNQVPWPADNFNREFCITCLNKLFGEC